MHAYIHTYVRTYIHTYIHTETYELHLRFNMDMNMYMYGHVQRMAEESLPKIALKWMPKQNRARGTPKENWMEGIKKAMNERNLNEGQWEDRRQWNLGVGQRRKTF